MTRTPIALASDSLARWSSALSAEEGKRSLLLAQRAEAEEARTQAQADLALWEQVSTLFAHTAEAAREQMRRHVEHTVTAALQAVFGAEFSFRIELAVKAGLPVAEWKVSSPYGDTMLETDPEDARGGGIVDVVSMALRLAVLELYQSPRLEGPIVLDEPARMISAEFQASFADFLKAYSSEVHRQVIMVTHSADLAEGATRRYMVSQANGQSDVRRG